MKLLVLALVLVAGNAFAAMPSAEDQIDGEFIAACYPPGLAFGPQCGFYGDSFD